MSGGIDRRTLIATGLAAAAVPGPSAAQVAGVGDASVAATARLKARPGTPTKGALPAGLHVLGLDPARDAHLSVPSGIKDGDVVPLIVMFHGKGQPANEVLGEWKRAAARHKCLVLAPSSRDYTWKVDDGPGGPDAQFVDRAMQTVFDHFAVAPQHIASAGFSDGGTYSLSIGLVNGDFFSDILAFSPIQYNAPTSAGRPRIFFCNGNKDPGAIVTNTASMVRQLKGDGYDVEFYEFDGGHWMDEKGVKKAMARFMGG
jgi:phospholipase/carboxylesterase